nr:uncharacterized mitochondrial protein AtMg00810-like [Tanacetum cinerariifolium]
MINSIKNGDQPLPRVTQVSIAGTTSTEQPPLKDKSMWSAQEKRVQKIDRLARSLLIQGLPNDIYSLINSNKTAKDLWDALARHMLGSEYDHLGKFNGKDDEGFLVGYSINSKAFRVFNSRTRKVEENMHINFLENKPNVTGSGPEWLFDIDSLTKSMNYEPVSVGNQSNVDAGDVNAGDIQGDVDEISRNVDVCQGNEFRIDSSTQAVNAANPSINSTSTIIDVGSLNINTADSNHINMLTLEATSIFNGAFDDRDLGAKADINNLDSSTVVSPIPTTRVHKDHPKEQIIGFPNLNTQTKRMINFSEETAMMSSMGELTFFLGLQVKPNQDDIFISQDKYVAEILKKFRFSKVKTTSTLMETSKPLLKDEDGQEVDVHMYRSMIGSLMYLTSSRPNIMFVVCACARHQVSPKASHLYAVKRIFRYLKGQPKLGNLQLVDVNSLAVDLYLDSVKSKQWLLTPQLKLSMLLLQVVMGMYSGYRINYLITGQNLQLLGFMLLKVYIAIRCHNSLYAQLQTFETILNSLPPQTLIQFTHHSSKSITMSTSTFAKTYNLIAYLEKPIESEGFKQIIDFLNGSSVKYALTVRPTIYTSRIKQFWTTAKVKKVDDEVRIQALVDGKRVNINESSIRRTLRLDDAEGTFCLTNAEIFEGLARMGVERLEEENRVLKELKSVHSKDDSDEPVMEIEKSSKQGRKIAYIDADVEINLEKVQAEAYNLDLDHQEKVLSMMDVNDEEPADVKEVLEVVKAAKLITKVVTTFGVDVNAASIQDTPITMDLTIPIRLYDLDLAKIKTIMGKIPILKTLPIIATKATKVSVPRNKIGVIIQDPEETRTTATVQPKLDGEVARQLEAELNANIDWNVVIEQVQRREKLIDAVMKYQALKRKPLIEAQARRNMIMCLKNMTGYKMDYFKGMCYDEIKPFFEKHYNYNQAFLNENFDREDLESLWNIVRERFAMTEPKKYSDDFLLNTLKIMFEKPNVKANTWKDQKGKYGLAKVKRWKLFKSCGVYCLTLSTTHIFLLIERMYHLTHFTLEQMMNDVRLKVEDGSEMSLELLRLVRRQLNEGYVP